MHCGGRRAQGWIWSRSLPIQLRRSVKLLDFGKFKYELSKKEKETRKKQHVISTKEIRMRPKIEEHDFEFKIKTPANSSSRGTASVLRSSSRDAK